MELGNWHVADCKDKKLPIKMASSSQAQSGKNSMFHGTTYTMLLP